MVHDHRKFSTCGGHAGYGLVQPETGAGTTG